MSVGNTFAVAVLILVALIVGSLVISHFFSEEAKQERRRRRSNQPIATKSKRPMVKFSVHTKRKKR